MSRPPCTFDGIDLREGLRVYHARRGPGRVMRVADQDSVVVRWDYQPAEPGRTTFVEAHALTARAPAQAAA